MNDLQRGKVFRDEDNQFHYYVRTAKITKDISYTKRQSDGKMDTHKKGTIVVFSGECQERIDEGRKRLYSFKFPDGCTFPLWEEEFEWEGTVRVIDHKRHHLATIDTYPRV